MRVLIFGLPGSGKTYLANLAAAQRRKLIASLHLQSYTNATISTTIQLEDELSQIAKQGFALDLEEFHDDMIAIAVPIYDNKKQFFAALGTHGPKNRFDKQQAMERLPLLLAAAEKSAPRAKAPALAHIFCTILAARELAFFDGRG